MEQEKFFTATVTYSQGLVKTWLVPSETLAVKFAAVVGRHGKIRSLRLGPEIDLAAARRLKEQGATFFFDLTDAQGAAQRAKEMARE